MPGRLHRVGRVPEDGGRTYPAHGGVPSEGGGRSREETRRRGAVDRPGRYLYLEVRPRTGPTRRNRGGDARAGFPIGFCGSVAVGPVVKHPGANTRAPRATHGAAARLTWKQVAAFRLSRHHLSERAPKGTLTSVVRDMTGPQAQVLSAAQISLWARVRDLRVEDVESALGRDRTLVKAWAMRRTLFLLPSEDLAIFVRGSARRADKELRWVRGRGFSDRVIEGLIQATLDALDRPITRRELAERVSQALGTRMRASRHAGWGNRAKVPGVAVRGLTFPAGYLLHLAGARGVACSGPSRGNEPTFVRADAWIPGWRDVPREQAEPELLRRYLRAFGPATPSDFSLWAGMTLGDAREIWARIAAEIVPVTVNGWEAAVLRDDLPQLERSPMERPPVRLLPYFDSFLLGHREREHLVRTKDRGRVYRPQGWIAPVVLVEGRVAGVWAHASKGHRLRVRVTKLATMPGRIRAGIHEEARDLGRFLGYPNVDVRIA